MKKYKKTIFQLNELIRHLVLDSEDVKKKEVGKWIDYWDRIEKENQEVFDEMYIDESYDDNIKL